MGLGGVPVQVGGALGDGVGVSGWAAVGLGWGVPVAPGAACSKASGVLICGRVVADAWVAVPSGGKPEANSRHPERAPNASRTARRASRMRCGSRERRWGLRAGSPRGFRRCSPPGRPAPG
ncbi:MAG TPA: hypothetical protein VJL34_09350 [Anaerolineales bacterium]|nr:hypothetical protein [Anaerolineales bacterium]